MYERVLVPTDGSEQADRAFERAVELAENFDSELHVLYVVDVGSLTGEVDAVTVIEQFEDHGEETIRALADRAEAAGVGRVETEVVEGFPHRAILDYADDHDVDLVVMGTHGRTGLDRFLLGSTTEKVVRLSDVPVMTVRTSEEGD